MSEAGDDAKVMLWGTQVGAVSWVHEDQLGYFQFNPDFLASSIQIAPLKMPLASAPYSFRALPWDAFKGLPGMLADVLPDKFGNQLIDAWLAKQNRKPESFSPVERLCYIGTRGMGALEFKPTVDRKANHSKKLDMARLVELANTVLDERTSLSAKLDGDDGNELNEILQVGTSAGGARAKAVIAWHPKTGEFRSGQINAGSGFEHWLLKFDGVSNNRDKELADPMGFGLIEYAYYHMAIECGINMMPCRIHEEGGRSHFMTRRFDRSINDKGDIDKLHMQSLAAMQHYNFNDPTAYAYEQALLTIRELGLGADTLEEQFRRTVFNIVARNQDDHVKNIAFLMDRSGTWRLSPAYDVTYSYNSAGDWTSKHQMSTNGKRDNFTADDLMTFASAASLKKSKAKDIINLTTAVVSRWLDFANEYNVDRTMAKQIAKTHRTRFAP